MRIEYNHINEDDDTTASVNVRVIRSCPGRQDCQIDYTGTAARSTVVNPPASRSPGQETPTLGSQTTPASSGCSAMNPNPTSGEYSGDGGCGISSTDFSIISGAQDTVVLEPFGGNGATSFSLLSPGSATANSARNDLTIHGVTGYSCTLTCSAPGTFTATSFKEGAATYTEKF